jgi:3-oxoacyl-[acyl-carrier protein] reductase
MLSLQGRTALVTGGSRGIGGAVCALFGKLGARVAVHFAHDANAARGVVADITGAGGEAVAVQADLSNPEAASHLIRQAEERLGPLDTVVVNHGIWKRAPITTMSRAEWDETIEVNLASAWAVCQATARAMIPRRAGAMVLVASTAGQRGEASHAHYAASKGALLALTKSLASELAPHGIRVNGVAPGWVLTDMTRHVLDAPEGAEALARIPLGRPGRPEEIAGPAAFLASDLASYLYGEILCVNGGAVMVG